MPGTTVPGSGSDHQRHVQGRAARREGRLVLRHARFLDWAPRVGLAWDVSGDGKTAIRASGGVFYNFVNRGQYLYNGGALIAQDKSPQRDDRRCRGIRARPERRSPKARRPAICRRTSRSSSTASRQAPASSSPERNYQANLAFQRDIGFNTVAEVAWVAQHRPQHVWRTKTIEQHPALRVRRIRTISSTTKPIAENFLRRDYPGVGRRFSYLTTDDDILNYNAMQLSVQRRLTSRAPDGPGLHALEERRHPGLGLDDGRALRQGRVCATGITVRRRTADPIQVPRAAGRTGGTWWSSTTAT